MDMKYIGIVLTELQIQRGKARPARKAPLTWRWQQSTPWTPMNCSPEVDRENGGRCKSLPHSTGEQTMTRQEFYDWQRKKAERQQRLIGLYETYRREYGDVDQWTKAISDKFDTEADAIRQEQ